MQDILGKVFVIILAVALFFIYPILNMYESQDDLNRQYVFVETTKFVDSIRNIGYITPGMYSEFSQSLSATDMIYNISIEHSHRNYDPVFDDIADVSTYQDDFNLYYIPYFTEEILAVLYPENGTGEDYNLSAGDYILVKVENRNESMVTKLREMIFGVNMPSKTISVRYGGMIKNEAN